MDPDNQNQSNNPYGFIMNPGPPPKRRLGMPGIKDPFFARLVLIGVGVVILLILAGVLTSFLFRGKTVDTEGLVGLTQTQQELIRVSLQGASRSSQPAVRDLSVTTRLSVDTNKLQLLDYLRLNGRKVTTKELNQKHSATTDARIAAALQTSTFDSVYVQLIQDSLVAYNTEVEAALARATGVKEKQILTKTAEAADLLLEQVPPIESIQPGT